jgi:DNA-binding MarR family transcriptional regulator
LHAHDKLRVAVAQTTSSDAHLVDAWRGLLDQHARVTCALERALRDHELGVSEYEVLDRLALSDDQHRRMQDVGADLHLSQSALSRVVGRLERDGLVKRGMCPNDRRGVMVCLTDEGRERWEAARPAHREALAEALGG